MKRNLLSVFTAVVLLALWAVPAQAGLDDAGTIILGGGGGYATISGNSRYGSEFGDGANYFFTGKFMVAKQMALGVFFQNQSYPAENLLPSLPTAEVVTKAVLATYEGHLIYYFNRVADACRYVDLGVGVYRPELRTNDINTGFPDSGLTFSATLGAEVFIRPQMAFDFSLRAVGYLGKGYTQEEEESEQLTEEDRALVDNTGTFTGALQGQVGLLFYLFD